MGDYDPKLLPQIDVVEIVDIRSLEPERVSQYMEIAQNQPFMRLEGELAQPFAMAWRSLVSGVTARCHIPPIGFRFIANGRIVLQASVCWECNNLYGQSEGVDISYAFDSDNAAAKTLFTLAKESIGLKTQGDDK